ncbi:MAG: DUF483 domain-containing protein [Methanobacteriales archaeon]|nr:MAG: Uncharacterized protein XD44_0042 [Methanobacteriaceae archaeon 41_258]
MLEEIYERIIKLREDGCQDGLKSICRMDEFYFNQLMARLQKEIEIVNKYNPPARPALDPLVSTELGIYRGDDYQIGRLLGYPECCVKSFSEETRFAIDKDHLKELEELDAPEGACALILPSGFIPCSLKCPRAWESKLIAYVDSEEYQMILELEEELKRELPHFHLGYNEYYEKLLIKKKPG